MSNHMSTYLAFTRALMLRTALSVVLKAQNPLNSLVLPVVQMILKERRLEDKRLSFEDT